MGKKSKYPAYSSGSVELNGNTIASVVKKDGNTISSSYNMGKTEKDIYNKVQSGLSNSLSGLFEISDEKTNQWNKQLDAYRKTGLEEINQTYTPMETSLKNDIASRFGNFDNSIFMENLNTITDKKAKAYADLSDNLLKREDELYTQEITNRIGYISLLTGLNETINANILNYMTVAQTNSNSGNNYNNQAYNAGVAATNSWVNTGLNLLNTASRFVL